MQEDELNEFSALFVGLFELYNKHFSKELLEFYWQILKGYDFQVVKRALDAHVYHPEMGRFLPKPADLVRWLEGCSEGRALKAWSRVTVTMESVGCYYSVAFDDPLIHTVIEEMGGWIRLCTVSLEALPFKAREFQKRYQALLSTEQRPHPPYLMGLIEQENSRKGYAYDPPVLLGSVLRAQAVIQSGQRQPLEVTRLSQAMTQSLLEIKAIEQMPSKKMDEQFFLNKGDE